jgi:hypothetical protein
VAIKMAETGFKNFPFALETGNHKRNEPLAIRARKLHAINVCGVSQSQKDVFLTVLFI